MKKEAGKPSLFLSVTVLAVIAVVLTAGIIAGVPTIPLLVVNIFLVLIISMLFGYPYRELEEGLRSCVHIVF